MRVIRVDDLPAQPWKNGAGVTREIARRENGGGLIWRLSVADVDRDAPFSKFDGFLRILTVIDGAGLRLIHPAGVIEARLGAPVRFAGDLPIACELIDGPVRDFNVIFDPKRISIAVDGIEPGTCKAPAGSLGVYALAGRCAVANDSVPVGAFAELGDVAAPEVIVDEHGAALLIRIEKSDS